MWKMGVGGNDPLFRDVFAEATGGTTKREGGSWVEATNTQARTRARVCVVCDPLYQNIFMGRGQSWAVSTTPHQPQLNALLESGWDGEGRNRCVARTPPPPSGTAQHGTIRHGTGRLRPPPSPTPRPYRKLALKIDRNEVLCTNTQCNFSLLFTPCLGPKAVPKVVAACMLLFPGALWMVAVVSTCVTVSLHTSDANEWIQHTQRQCKKQTEQHNTTQHNTTQHNKTQHNKTRRSTRN